VKIDHVAIKSFDIKRDVEWYFEKFGVKTLYQDSTWALLDSKGSYLALVTPAQHPPHFSFLMESEIPQDSKMHRDGTYSKYIKDPSGNIVELLWRATSDS
jgi:hypothetical protein